MGFAGVNIFIFARNIDYVCSLKSLVEPLTRKMAQIISEKKKLVIEP